MHVGDLDPSGQSIFEAMAEDAGAFVRMSQHRALTASLGERAAAEGSALVPIRVALTEEQVDEHDLPTAPPKSSDTRSRSWAGETCQAEAMPPTTLAEVVREAVESRLDRDAYDAVVEEEGEDRASIEGVLEGLDEGG